MSILRGYEYGMCVVYEYGMCVVYECKMRMMMISQVQCYKVITLSRKRLKFFRA